MDLATLLLFGLATIAGASILRLVLRWSHGRSATAHLNYILRAPQRYLVNVHRKVVRRRHIGPFHAITALGFLALFFTAIMELILVPGGPVLASVIATAAFAGLAGSIALAITRWKRRALGIQKRLHFVALACFLIGYGLTFSAHAIPLSLNSTLQAIVWIIAMVGTLGVGSAVWGPLKHAVAGYVNLSVHERPDRFERDSAAITFGPLPLSFSQPKLGAEFRSDLSWKRLVQFDACVECGRCSEVCPANAAGTALDPMSLIKAVQKAGPEESLYDAIGHDALWACTTCSACVEACPMFIEHIDTIIDVRRHVSLELPGALDVNNLFENLNATDQSSGRPLSERLDWASDLQVRKLLPGESTTILFWIGDAGFHAEGHKILRAVVALLRMANLDFAVLPEEGDIGDVPLRLGQEALFRDLASANASRLDAVAFDRILTIDPHVLQALRSDYGLIGRTWDVVHHSVLLDEIVELELLRPVKTDDLITFHDPCYLGRHSKQYDAPRRLVSAIGPTVEMTKSRESSFCCGFGGGAVVTDVPSKARIPDLRMMQAMATGAKILATGCPNCAVMLEGVSGTKLQVQDVATLLLQRLENA